MKKPRTPKPTDCGHGKVLNPCRISTDPVVTCQACARMVMYGEGSIFAVVVPAAAIPPPGGTILVTRDADGAFVYRP